MHIETKSRSLAKALSWRIIASITTAAIAYAFGVPMKAVGLIFVADLIIKFLYILFLAIIGTLMLVESTISLVKEKTIKTPSKRRSRTILDLLPFKLKFRNSKII